MSKHAVLSVGSYGLMGGIADAIEPKCTVWRYHGVLEYGEVLNWAALAKSIKEVLNHLDTDQLLVQVPVTWRRGDLELLCKNVFENTDTETLAIVSTPLAAALGTNTATALVIDIGHQTTSISPVVDGRAQKHAVHVIPVGMADVKAQFMDWKQAKESLKADQCEVLFENLRFAVIGALRLCPTAQRGNLCSSVILTGQGSRVKGIYERIRAELQMVGVRECQFYLLPEYLESYKDAPHLTPYLGASLMARLMFPDPKNVVSKSEYLVHGPEIVHTRCF